MSKQWPDKTIVGLTGNIATGKSAVMQMAAGVGALTIDADKVVHQLLETEPVLQEAVVAAFGPDVRRGDGTIDRPALGGIVFSDPQALRRLEQILHPAVRQEIYRQIDESRAPVVFIEAIKLLEGELAQAVDQVWVTRVSRGAQIERLVVCRGLDVETATMRVNAQPPQEAKVARADVVIDTDGTMAATQSQFEIAWERLAARSGDGARQATAKAAPVKTAVAPQKSTRTAPVKSPSPSGMAPASILVRRARPSDVAAVLLLIQRATGGRVKMKRADLLLALSERSYLIAQENAEINMVVGWSTHSTTAVAVDQIYVHPEQAAFRSGPAVLAEIEKSARELICEVIFIFLTPDVPVAVEELLEQSGYRKMRSTELHRAWREVVSETQPGDTQMMGKILRDVRVR